MDINDVTQYEDKGNEILMFEAVSSGYGINGDDYNDMKVGYLPSKRAFYTCSKVDDNLFLIVAITLSGDVLFSSHTSGKIENHLRNVEALLKEANINKALQHFKKVFSMLMVIVMKYRQKLNTIKFVARSTFQERRFEQFLRSGNVKNSLTKLSYKPSDKIEDPDGVAFVFSKTA